MPEESKKNQQKSKHGPKDQRKPRQGRQQALEKNQDADKSEKHKPEEPKAVAPQVNEPGPEFYKNLKRETDDILKITEEANSKYKKKEIQSNWSKYEMPIPSYDEVVEEENIGADYEKLIQAPQSIGGHFQFKHERSWDITTEPSQYDKYFEINMEDLVTALSSIPFYERNSIDKSVFSQSDIDAMNSRAVRYKQKYFNVSTTESEIQDKILNKLKESDINIEGNKEKAGPISKDIIFEESSSSKTKALEGSPEIDLCSSIDRNNVAVKESKDLTDKSVSQTTLQIQKVHEIEISNTKEKSKQDDLLDDLIAVVNPSPIINVDGGSKLQENTHKQDVKNVTHDPAVKTDKPKNIESPEDLEKWLDDFLDG